MRFLNKYISWLIFGICVIALLPASIVVFLIDLHATADPGTRAGALGSVVGGVIGAGAAVMASVAAVFLSIEKQRNEEKQKISRAIKTEIYIFSKFIIGTLEICISIRNGFRHIVIQDTNNISRALVADPVIYPAIADRIGLLPHPEATVDFYMRIAEAKAMTAILASSHPFSPRQTSSPQNVTAMDVIPIVECLITALDHAATILGTKTRSEADRDWVSTAAQNIALTRIYECRSITQHAFPNAEVFQPPSE